MVVGIEKEAHPRQIVVELEQADVHVVHPGQANAHKLRQQFFQFLVLGTNNLFVNVGAVNSRLAPDHDEEGFTRLPGFRAAGGIIPKPHLRRHDPPGPAAEERRLLIGRGPAGESVAICQPETRDSKGRNTREGEDFGAVYSYSGEER
jgi:hypothetical protein